MRDWREKATSAARRLLDRRFFNEFLTQRRVAIVLIFAIEAALIFIVSSAPFLPGEEQVYSQTVNGTASIVTGEDIPGQIGAIFLNNFRVATSMLAPLLGQFAFLISNYNTARAIEVIALVRGVSPALLTLDLYSLPHTWIETSAYALALTEACYLFWAVTRRGTANFSWNACNA